MDEFHPLNMELKVNKLKNENDKDKKLFENKIKKKTQLLNQALEKQKDEYMLNIMMQQMMMAKMMENNLNQENL